MFGFELGFGFGISSVVFSLLVLCSHLQGVFTDIYAANAAINNISHSQYHQFAKFDAATFLIERNNASPNVVEQERNITHEPKELVKTTIVLRDAYIITTKDFMPQNALNAAEQCGFKPQLFRAVIPTIGEFGTVGGLYRSCLPEVRGKKHVREALKKLSIDRRLTLGEVALICSHRRVVEKIANHDDHGDNDWSLVLEDDATIHPDVSDPSQDFVNTAMQVMASIGNQYGFIYFGFKHGASIRGPRGCRDYYAADAFNITNSYKSMISADCDGHGTHAYAITKKRAKTFFSEIYDEEIVMADTKFPQIDQVFSRKFVSLFDIVGEPVHNYVLGVDLISPLQDEIEGELHRGIIYQGNMSKLARSGAGSSLRRANRFTDGPHITSKLLAGVKYDVIVDKKIKAQRSTAQEMAEEHRKWNPTNHTMTQISDDPET